LSAMGFDMSLTAAERNDLDRLRCEIAALRFQSKLLGAVFHLRRKYNPAQPRLPAGTPDGGQWASDGSSASIRASARDQLSKRPRSGEPRRLVAQYDIGRLVAEIPAPGGRRCVYKFQHIAVVVHGSVNFPCSPTMPSAGVVHGYLLNDNNPQ